MVAGIQNGVFRHWVVPAETLPEIQLDDSPLTYMQPEQIRNCAMRVLYRGTRIAVEFFHSLTDGYGGFQFLRTLLAKYLELAHGVVCASDAELLLPNTPVEAAEIEDSYTAYAGKEKAKHNHVQSYQIAGGKTHGSNVFGLFLNCKVQPDVALYKSFGWIILPDCCLWAIPKGNRAPITYGPQGAIYNNGCDFISSWNYSNCVSRSGIHALYRSCRSMLLPVWNYPNCLFHV